jgi:hypothetical protein
MGGGFEVKRAGIIAVVLCALLALAPAAVAKSVHYYGPLVQPAGAIDDAAVEFTVKAKKKGKKPVALTSFHTYNAWSQDCDVYYPAVRFPKELLPVTLSKGSFTARATVENGDFYEITGTVPKNGGPASGTVQLTNSDIGITGTENCDTGVLSWSATVFDNKP